MNRLLQWIRLARSMGYRYVFFRVNHELKSRSGILKKSFPVDPPFQTWITLSEWRKSSPPFFFTSRDSLKLSGAASSDLKQKAERILKGEIQFFHGEWRRIEAHDWLTNPTNGYRYEVNKHWTEIPDFHPSYGDIKYVWERSRFTFLQTVLRYDAYTGADSSKWVFEQIASWIEHNPINQGPNWRCSQETSLRVFNWTLALYFYKESSNLAEELFQKIIFSVYWQIRHVRSNINFSRIAVRNNHAITETLALYTSGLLFPFFNEAQEWKRVGKKWFEEEVAYQVYEDGSYLQFSFNYHRVVVQLLTWAISLANRHHEKFSDVVYARVMASLNLLMTCQDTTSGKLPNYGANDGSLFFQWNDCDFRDFNPALSTLHFLLTSSTTSSNKALYEDLTWFGINEGMNLRIPLQIPDGEYSFLNGGLYVFRKDSWLIMINCVRYKDRPSQADNLHLDVWYDGHNVLRDAGSYRYNAEPSLVKYFFGTESHNTVMIEDQDQMQKGPRFIWMDWSAARKAGWEVKDDAILFRGIIGMKLIDKIVEHTRTVQLKLSEKCLVVTDEVRNKGNKTLRQLWHLDPASDAKVTFKSTDSGGEVSQKESMKYYSPTYGVLETSKQIEFQTNLESITTQIYFT